MKNIVDDLRCTAKQFIEVYLDLNHVTIAHPGLNSWVDVRNAKVSILPDQVIQYAPFNPWKKKWGAYKDYYDAWRAHNPTAPVFGAEWKLSFKSGRMYERYPGMSVLSTVFDSDFEYEIGCVNTISFSAPTGTPSEVFEAAVKAYIETAEEDKFIVENIAKDVEMVNVIGGTFHPILPNCVKPYRRYLEENK